MQYQLSDFDEFKIDVSEPPKEKVSFSPNAAPEIDLSKFDLSERVRGLIESGWQGNSGYKSRSEADMGVITALCANGATPERRRR